ncbi:hypothetical protein FOA43_000381 [Brettanomyces nanus]|uniref:non-specific serine/threonine protein kinase n=1 Tax=Eeniella nana TaxID=13502 RepID=A0A875RW89_EENNA|nr:uncharacterized protein FOA43_000381 [Brettanomyces nanus]QPG73076.1 hypothetical protein FOA43_000381 [Brettanomyces nanus]
MGPELALMVPSAQTVAVSAYIDFIPGIQYSKPLGASRFLKAVKCLDTEGAVVVKLLIKPDSHLNLTHLLKQMEDLREKLVGVPNVLPFHSIIDSQRACYFMRPYIRFNLYDRLSIRPFLEGIEKKWIIYQLISAIARIHAKGITHGDIKTENILMTSWNWCLISDFATFKPVYLPEANPSQFSFYFDTSQRHVCYVAPERFVNSTDEGVSNMNEGSSVTEEMDIFALGCTIAEIYTEGLPIFTLPQMFKYKKGEYLPNLDGVGDPGIKKMVLSMISINPANRLKAEKYLAKYRKIAFPDHFYTFLHPYLRKLSVAGSGNEKNNNSMQQCDYRINQIYQDFDKIALYLGFKKYISEEPTEETTFSIGESAIPLRLSLPGMHQHIPRRTSEVFKRDSIPDCSTLILLSVVLYNVRNTTHAAFRIKACDLMIALTEQLHDAAKLDRCLPYLVYMLDDPSEDVQAAALRSMTQLLFMVDSITPVNVSLFPEYLIPKLRNFLMRSYLNPEGIEGSKPSDDNGITEDNGNNYSNTREPTRTSYIRTAFAACLPHLALAAQKFYDMSNLLTTQMKLFNDPETENNLNMGNGSLIDANYQKIVDGFEFLTIRIMTDSDPYVRIGLLNNILPLCTFFGKEKTNDVILSHLITYLNYKDPQLKIAFVSSIVTVSIFVGVVSLEQYILPLLVQALPDPSELVVLELLKVFAELVKLGFIRKQYLWDLVKLNMRLILHPNQMIRDAVLNLIIAVGDTLPVADLYCMLYPLIRPYFRHEVTSFTWESLFMCAHSPIPRSVYSIAKSWSLTHEPTLFWQKASRAGGNNTDSSNKIDSFGNKQVSFMKKSGSRKRPQIFRSSSSGSNGSNTDNNVVENYEIPLSVEDSKQVERFKNIGFPESELWKLATLRSYIYRVAHVGSGNAKNENRDINYTRVNISPRSVFVDVNQQREVPKQQTKRSDDDYRKGRKAMLSKIDASNSKSTPWDKSALFFDAVTSLPSIGRSPENAIGDAPSLHGKTSSLSIMGHGNYILSDRSEFNVQNETLNLQKLITKIRHSYSGNNTYILKFLRSLSFEPTLNDYTEFGSLIETGEALSTEENGESSGESVLISRLLEHKSSINCVRSSPDYSFFVTGDEQGLLKLWDTARLETNVTGRSFCSLNLGSAIKSIDFMANRCCLSVSTGDGFIKIFRVDMNLISGSHRKTATIVLIREYKVPTEDLYAMGIQFSVTNEKPYLAYYTPTCKVVILDLRTLSIVTCIQNDISHGLPTAFAIGANSSWILIGTSKGILDLWDTFFELQVKSTIVKPPVFPFKQIKLLPNSFQLDKARNRYVVTIGETGDSDVIIWDVSKLQPRLVLCSSSEGSTIDRYSVRELKDDVDSVNNEISELPISIKSIENDKSCTALSVISSPVENSELYIVSVTCAGKVTLWNLLSPTQSRVIVEAKSSTDTTKTNCLPKFSETQVNSNLTFINEIYASTTGNTNQKSKSGSTQNSTKLDALKRHQDRVNDVAMIFKPYPMVISVDRSGVINVYK